MSGGLTVSEIEKWVKLDSSNSITEDAEYLYRIAANIPAIPNNIYNSFSITPSILKLAKGYPFSNLQEKSKGKSKSKKEIKPKINNPYFT